MNDTLIRKATIGEVKSVVSFIDGTFTKEGYGFVTSAQIETEIKRGAVWVAIICGEISGVRIGKQKVYNLAVAKEHRRKGIGEKLINIYRPEKKGSKRYLLEICQKNRKKNLHHQNHSTKNLGLFLVTWICKEFLATWERKGTLSTRRAKSST